MFDEHLGAAARLDVLRRLEDGSVDTHTTTAMHAVRFAAAILGLAVPNTPTPATAMTANACSSSPPTGGRQHWNSASWPHRLPSCGSPATPRRRRSSPVRNQDQSHQYWLSRDPQRHNPSRPARHGGCRRAPIRVPGDGSTDRRLGRPSASSTRTDRRRPGCRSSDGPGRPYGPRPPSLVRAARYSAQLLFASCPHRAAVEAVMPKRSLTMTGGRSDTASIMAVFRALRMGRWWARMRVRTDVAVRGLLGGRPGKRKVRGVAGARMSLSRGVWICCSSRAARVGGSRTGWRAKVKYARPSRLL